MSWDMGQVPRHNSIRNLSPTGRGDEEGGRATRIKNVCLTYTHFLVRVYLSELGFGQDIA